MGERRLREGPASPYARLEFGPYPRESKASIHRPPQVPEALGLSAQSPCTPLVAIPYCHHVPILFRKSVKRTSEISTHGTYQRPCLPQQKAR